MLALVLGRLPPIDDPNVLVGTSTADDAGVYRLSGEIGLVQTVDFFTPIVDDPKSFGRIAAANALSDVYAMGGRPLCALAIAAFPEQGVDLSVLADILAGGVEKAYDAGIPIIGGHTIKDREPKYGLAVSGTVHPEKIIRNSTAHADDVLVLTKPIGTGILTTARRGDAIEDDALATAVASMETLNRAASEVMVALDDSTSLGSPVHAATDITGFGLVGHLLEVARGSGLGVELQSGAVPFFDLVLDLAERGIVPAGSRANYETAVEAGVAFAPTIPRALRLALCDAQTSGGLLICIAGNRLDELSQALIRAGVKTVGVVGTMTRDPAFRVI